MKKIVVFNLVSVDGYYVDAYGRIDWHLVDKEFDRFAVEQMQEFDIIILGRKTYKLFYPFWPNMMNDHSAAPEDLQVAKMLDAYKKGEIVKQLSELRLVDEYRLMMVPIVLGRGRSFFEG